MALVIGGGNIFRGLAGAAKGMDRVSADHMGIMATVMNALAMQGVLEVEGRRCARALGHRHADGLRNLFRAPRASTISKTAASSSVPAGTGLPFFTTDTGAALRAAELHCDALFKGTSVDGVYSADPKKDPSRQAL